MCMIKQEKNRVVNTKMSSQHKRSTLQYFGYMEKIKGDQITKQIHEGRVIGSI